MHRNHCRYGVLQVVGVEIEAAHSETVAVVPGTVEFHDDLEAPVVLDLPNDARFPGEEMEVHAFGDNLHAVPPL